MKNRILPIFLISVLLGGCSMLSPFKSINSCSDAKNNGAPCASVESNLEYSIEKDNTEKVPATDPEAEKGGKAADTPDPTIHAEDDVTKDEIVRLMAEMSIDTNATKKPALIPARTYRLLIFPYTSGERFYSARYVYITAGKPTWVTGNYIISDGAPLKIDVPAAETPVKKPEDVIKSIDISGGGDGQKATDKSSENVAPETDDPTGSDIIDETPSKPVKHRVNAYLLNCRDMPGLNGNSIAVFEKDRVLDIVDKSFSWWEVSFYDTSCYVNPKYLYSEPEE